MARDMRGSDPVPGSQDWGLGFGNGIGQGYHEVHPPQIKKPTWMEGGGWDGTQEEDRGCGRAEVWTPGR